MRGRVSVGWKWTVLFVFFVPVLLLGSSETKVRMTRKTAMGEEQRSGLVLRDVRVEMSPAMIASSGSYRLQGILEVVEETEPEEGENSSPGLLAEGSLPIAFSLSQNYPNPFNPSTTIGFSVPGEGVTATSLRIYDVRGHLVRTLIDDELFSANYRVHWDGTDDSGQRVSSGVYLYKLISGGKFLTRKMTVAQ